MSSLAGKMQIWQSLTTIGVTALTKFIEDARPRNMSGGGIVTVRSGAAAPECDVLAQLEVIEPILDKFYSEWQRTTPLSTNYRFNQQHEGAQRCHARLASQVKVQEKLGGSSAPQLGADELHGWVWDAARPQWDSGHFGGVVAAACNSVNARLQQRTGRDDISNTDLARQTFTRDLHLA